MLPQMKLTNKDVGVVIAKDGQGLITIDDFTQLNEKYVEGLWKVLRRPGGTTGWVTDPGVAVSTMAEADLKRMIYYIKHFKRIRRAWTYDDVELSKVREMYHQRDM